MAGIPVVGARTGGIADLVEQGRTGLLYDSTSPVQLRSALRSLIENPEQMAALGGHVRSAPRVKAMADDAREWEETYADVVRRREVVGLAP